MTAYKVKYTLYKHNAIRIASFKSPPKENSTIATHADGQL